MSDSLIRVVSLCALLIMTWGANVTPTSAQPATIEASSAPAPRHHRPAKARMPPALDAIRLGGHVSLGLGGEYEQKFVATGQSINEGLAVTYGLDAFVDLPVHRYITLGAVARFSSYAGADWAQANLDRGSLLDLALQPKVRYPFLSNSTLIEIYAGLPLGLTLGSMSDDLSQGSIEFQSGTGLTVGVLAGVNVFLSNTLALTFELGYVRHSFTSDATAKGAGVSTDVAMSLGQVRLNGGLLVTL